MCFNALEKKSVWYVVCCSTTGCPFEIYATENACREEIEKRVASGIPASYYIIQKIVIDSAEVV